MSEVKIKAESRTQFGKGAARRLRRTGMVPAVLYGHGTDPVHVALPGHELMLALKSSNALLSVDLGDKAELTIPKQVQRDPIKGFLEHVDLLIVKRGERVVVDVPVVLVGDAGPGTTVSLDATSLSLEAEATHIPEQVEVSIEGAEAGFQLHAGEAKLPAGSTLNADPELLIVHVSAETEVAVEAEEGAEGAGEPAEAGAESAEAASQE